MDRDLVASLQIHTGQGGPPARGPEMGLPVEPVAPDAVILVPLVGKGVDVRRFGHGLVEGGIEDGDLRHLRQEFLRGTDPGQVRRVVQRRKRRHLLDRLRYLLVDPDRPGELLPAVRDPVPHRADPAGVRDDPFLRIGERVENELQGPLVVRALGLQVPGVLAVDLVRQEGVAQDDPLDGAACQGGPRSPIEKLVLHGEPPAVECENKHAENSGPGLDGVPD